MAAWRRFTVCLSALPENEAASILSAVQNEIIARACTRDAIEPRRDQVFFALLPMRFPSSFSGKQFYVNHLISFGFHRAALHMCRLVPSELDSISTGLFCGPCTSTWMIATVVGLDIRHFLLPVLSAAVTFLPPFSAPARGGKPIVQRSQAVRARRSPLQWR